MINRRQFLSAAAATGAAFSAGSVVGARPVSAQTDTISIALAARSPGGLNPQQTGLTGGDNWGLFQVYDTLVKAPDGRWAVRPEEFLPSLAESWETSDDARVWTYKLRRGVRFHKNYGDLTSDDVVFTFGRHLDPGIVTANKVFFSNIEKVEVVDPLTVRFMLKRPDPLFNGSCASHQSGSIICKSAFEEKGEGFNNDPIGTGPYQMQSIDQSDGVRLTAFAEHFAGAPATPNLHISFIADTTARTLAFASGQVDMIEGVRAPGWLNTMRQRSADTIFDMTAPGSHNALNINLTRSPLENLKVRQAIRYGIDNAAIAGAFGEMARPMVGIIASRFPGAVTVDELPDDLKYKHDPEKAKALLAEAGHPDGITIQCYTSQREDYASIMLMIQEQLRACNIKLDMGIIDHATFHADNRSDKNALALYSSSFPPVPTIPVKGQLAASAEVKADGTGGGNYSHYGVAMKGIDELVEKAEDEPEFDKRIAIMKEVETQILRDLPLLGIITLSYVIARNPRVDLGYKVESGPAFWALSKAKRTA
jgi:ABC-type transport system substrate-binding protein